MDFDRDFDQGVIRLIIRLFPEILTTIFFYKNSEIESASSFIYFAQFSLTFI